MHIKVKISIYAMLREKLGWKEKEIIIDNNNPVLIEVLEREPELYKLIIDDKGNIRKGYMILVNGIHIELKKGIKTPIHDGDEIAIFPPGGGG